jgi:hypothetical protein
MPINIFKNYLLYIYIWAIIILFQYGTDRGHRRPDKNVKEKFKRHLPWKGSRHPSTIHMGLSVAETNV